MSLLINSMLGLEQRSIEQCRLISSVRVQDAALTDDVVEFMALQLQKLPDTTQTILKLAACIGGIV